MSILKSLLASSLVLTMLFSALPVFAQEAAADIVLVRLDGSLLNFDVPAQVINGRTMVPMRAIFEEFEAKVTWDDATQTVTAVKAAKTIKLTIDNKTATVDGQDVALDVPAMLLHDRTMVPVRFIAESLNAIVAWDEASKTVSISNPDFPKWPAWDKSILDNAVSANTVSLPLDNTFKWKSSLETSQAMYALALMTYYNPRLKDSKGALVADRLLAQIRSLIKGGNEPSCLGGLGGWIDNAAAQTLVMAKNTPSVWSRLTADEIKKCDFVMQAMTVVGNYTQNYLNSPKTDMSQITTWENGWNPNHQEGYVGIMIAAHIYFGGADQVDAFLKNFKFDDYIKQMDEYGYVNMKKNYESTGKELLEKGGNDALGGTTKGAKLSFTYKDILTGNQLQYDPMVLYVSLAKRMYYHKVQSKVYDKSGTLKGFIADGTESPYEGQVGMGYEFISNDAEGIRTSADYFVTGWRNSVITRASLEALEYWQGKDAQAIEKTMLVGSEDFLYKAQHGYHGWSKGRDLGVQSESTNFKGIGYQYMKEIWLKALKEKPIK